jgi:hypothetical protein
METDPTREYKYTVLSSKSKTKPSDSIETKILALNQFVSYIVNLNNHGDVKCVLVGGIAFGNEPHGAEVYQSILISFPKNSGGKLRKRKTRSKRG